MEQITIKEALKHIGYANYILKDKADLKGNYYTDSNYVKLAANIAWDGVLIAMQYKMANTGFKFPPHGKKNIEIYRDYLAKNYKSTLKDFNSAYSLLYLLGGYHGELYAEAMNIGLAFAKNIITWCEK